MLNKFFQSFHEPKSSDENTFQSDLYNLIYEIIIADHEISPVERLFLVPLCLRKKGHNEAVSKSVAPIHILLCIHSTVEERLKDNGATTACDQQQVILSFSCC